AGPSMQAAFADEMAKYAQREYEASLQNGVPEASVLADLKLERQRLKAEVAQLRAEMWREHSYEPLLVEQLQWQIDRLAEEVVELNHRVQELE
ncbi:MAG: hypothetical protein KDA63_13485, partial [Planctomycetales bacterium]|nr:hypothetical protein [Planctomycetales bacterium]